MAKKNHAPNYDQKPRRPFTHLGNLLLTLFLLVATTTSHADVSVTGLNSAAEKNLLLVLSLTKEKCTSPTWKINHLFTTADQEIDQALRALGYYHASSKNTLHFNKDCWQADFAVTPGPRVKIDKITISYTGDAVQDPEFTALRKKLVEKKSQPLRHDHYEAMKSRIESLALERGYLNGAFSEKKLQIDKTTNTAQIILRFAAGKRMKFGDISIDQDVLNQGFVKKFISIKPGDYYSSEQLASLYNNLSKSGYFDIVDIRPDTKNTKQAIVPISIKLYPKKRHHYSVGLGFDTDIGPLLSGAYNNSRINSWGHLFNANLDLSPVLSTAAFEYSVPLENPISNFLSFGGGLKREDTSTLQSLSTKLSVRLKNAFDNGWKQTLFIDSIYEDFTTGTTSNQVLLLVPGGSWLRSVSDSILRPTRGHRIELNLAGSYKNPISDVSFAQGSLAAVWSQPTFWGGRFIARTQQGVTLVDQFDKLPTSFRYYAGGMNSIRGYAYKELGPKDDQGNVVGGRFLSVLSAEYEQSILEDWSAAAFIDGGNAYNLDALTIKVGAGLGIRWYSPIGPIRLDFAIPLNESDSSFQVHFAAGTRL